MISELDLKKYLNKFEVKLIPESIQKLDIDDSIYFGKDYKKYTSNSRLNLIDINRGGGYYKYIKNEFKGGASYLSVGSAIHQMTLEKDTHELMSFTKPSAKVGLMVESVFNLRSKGYSIYDSFYKSSEIIDYYKKSFNIKHIKNILSSGFPYYKELYKDSKIQSSKNKIYLDKRGLETVNTCLSVLNSSQAYKTMFPDSLFNDIEINNEKAFICECEVSFPKDFDNESSELNTIIIPIKLKIDNYNLDFDNKVARLNDLKTTSKPNWMFTGSTVKETGEFIEGSFQKYNYCNQIAFYFWIWRTYLSHNNIIDSDWKFQSNIICVETLPNYQTNCFSINNKWIRKGFKDVIDLLKMSAYAEFNRDEILNNIENE